jgi:hypothetical protein
MDVIERRITNNVVRLGGRGDEALNDRVLEKILATRPRSQMDNAARAEFRDMKEIEDAMTALMESITTTSVPESDMNSYLEFRHPNHDEQMHFPPLWIQLRFDEDKTWSKGPQTLLEFWIQSADLNFITPPPIIDQTLPPDGQSQKPSETRRNRYDVLKETASDISPPPSDSDEQSQKSWGNVVRLFFDNLGHPSIPPLPSTNRPLDLLLEDDNVWKMAPSERRALYDFWTQEVRQSGYANQIDEFARLKVRHAEARERWEAINNEVRVCKSPFVSDFQPASL